MNAKKQTYIGDDAWSVIAGAEKLYVASGKNIIEFKPDSTNKEEILKKITGRTGNLRAPTLKRGNVFFVGFNVDLYTQII